MSILGKLFDVIKKIVQKIIDFVVRFIKKYWWVLLIIAAIYFAPALGAFFTANGLGAIGSLFTTIGSTITPSLVSFGTWAWEGLSALGTSAWTAFKGLEFGTQLAVVAGAASLIAPEETADLLTEVGETVTDVVGGVVGGVLAGVPGWVWLAGAGALIFFLLAGKRKEEVVYVGNDLRSS